jgi:hypothetical protein
MDIYSEMDKFREEYSLRNKNYYENKISNVKYRYDTKEVIFIKIMLQRELPKELRKIILNKLFCKYVSSDESAFSSELYMNVDQLKCIYRNGMFIGSHGYDHYWLNTLQEEEQRKEINLSLEFLRKMGCNTDKFVFCYPFGSYNDSLLSILRENGCGLGLTTQVGIADLDGGDPLILPRLDTNDLPKTPDAFAVKE